AHRAETAQRGCARCSGETGIGGAVGELAIEDEPNAAGTRTVELEKIASFRAHVHRRELAEYRMLAPGSHDVAAREDRTDGVEQRLPVLRQNVSDIEFADGVGRDRVDRLPGIQPADIDRDRARKIGQSVKVLRFACDLLDRTDTV